jgi:hypothetical protein
MLDAMVEGDISAEAEEQKDKSMRTDRWLLESTYKSSVRILLSQWKIRSEDMKSLYHSILDLDVWRRNRLQQILLTFLPKRRRLFLRIQQTLEPGVDALESGRIDLTQADEQLEDTVERLSRQRISKRNMHRSNIMNRSRSRQPTLDERFEEDKPELNVDVLDSPFIEQTKVVEAKLPASGDWQIGVVICTLDQTMHLFVLAKGSEGDLSLPTASPQEVMRLLPPDSMAPALTAHLPTCRFKLSSDVSFVDVTPEKTKRPVSLRMINSAEVIAWHDQYNKPKVIRIEQV